MTPICPKCEQPMEYLEDDDFGNIIWFCSKDGEMSQ